MRVEQLDGLRVARVWLSKPGKRSAERSRDVRAGGPVPRSRSHDTCTTITPMRGHDHAHRLGANAASGAALTLVFVTVEALFGWFGPSLALLSDAGHNLADAASLGFSWYAVVDRPQAFASRDDVRLPPGRGAGRARQRGVAGGDRAVDRLGSDRSDPHAAGGQWRRDDRRRRCGDRRQPGDRVLAARRDRDTTSTSAAPTCISSATRPRRSASSSPACWSATTGQPLADPIVSLLIAGLILFSSYGVLTESTTVLLEGTPAGTDMPAVIAAIKGVDRRAGRPRPPRLDGRSRRRRLQLPHRRRGTKRPRGPAGPAGGRRRARRAGSASPTRPFRWKSKGARTTTCTASPSAR